jgi:S-adenosyl methyltransferase
MQIWPEMIFTARANRAFLGRAVRYLAGEAGVRQFLDIGTGIPTAGNTHQVAQAIAPESRVVYVDYDPIVLAHARALLISGQAADPAEGRLPHPRAGGAVLRRHRPGRARAGADGGMAPRARCRRERPVLRVVRGGPPALTACRDRNQLRLPTSRLIRECRTPALASNTCSTSKPLVRSLPTSAAAGRAGSWAAARRGCRGGASCRRGPPGSMSGSPGRAGSAPPPVTPPPGSAGG